VTVIGDTFLMVMADKRAYGTGTLVLKDGVWWARWWTRDGRRPNRKLGRARHAGHRDGLTKKQAEQMLRELIASGNAGTRSRGRDDPTIAQLGQALIARLEAQGRKPSHIEGVRCHLRAHIEPVLGELQVGQVDDRDVTRLIDRLIAKGRSPKTIRNLLGTLHSVFEIARRDRLIAQNPCDLAEVPAPRPSRDIRFLTPDELESVLEAGPPPEAPRAERDWWPVVRLLVLTAAMTGMRLGELRALRWQDLDMAAMKVRVRQSYVLGQYGAPKSRRSARAIPLASRLVAELDEHHRTTVWNGDGDLVLAHPHTGRPLDRVRLLGHFKAALRRANVRPVRIHDLRHTFATTIAASGEVSLRTLQEWMGHLDARTTQIYADYMPGEREAELIDNAFNADPNTRLRSIRGPIFASEPDGEPPEPQ
jgi:integrase